MNTKSSIGNETNETHIFDEWKAIVNQIVQRKCGLSCDDLPDYDYMSEWEGGSTASDCADAALEEAGFDEDGFDAD